MTNLLCKHIKRRVYNQAQSAFYPRLKSALNQRNGQTLIETMVAVFILTMGITAATGLAIFSLNSSSNITKQIIATGLAREGLEAARAMRGTNWLKGMLSTNCYNYQTGNQDGKCYQDWLGDDNFSPAPYCLNPTKNNGNCSGSGGSNVGNYYLGINPSDYSSNGSPPFWNLQVQFNSNNYGLNFDSSGTNGFYSPSNSLNGNSDYYRKIIITKNPVNTPSAFTQDSYMPLVEVRSQVWWTDKKCPRVTAWPGPGKCSLELVTYLTNWKNY